MVLTYTCASYSLYLISSCEGPPRGECRPPIFVVAAMRDDEATATEDGLEAQRRLTPRREENRNEGLDMGEWPEDIQQGGLGNASPNVARQPVPGLEGLSARPPASIVTGPSGWVYQGKSLLCLPPHSAPRLIFIHIIEAPLFEPLIAITIGANMCTMAWASPMDPSGTWKADFIAVRHCPALLGRPHDASRVVGPGSHSHVTVLFHVARSNARLFTWRYSHSRWLPKSSRTGSSCMKTLTCAMLGVSSTLSLSVWPGLCCTLPRALFPYSTPSICRWSMIHPLSPPVQRANLSTMCPFHQGANLLSGIRPLHVLAYSACFATSTHSAVCTRDASTDFIHLQGHPTARVSCGSMRLRFSRLR